jgi:hypothetical protein
MRTVNFLISAAFCLAVLSAPAAAPNARSIMLAQADRTPSPNALDAQDRFRDRERERAHEEVKERLGDRSPGLNTNSQGFEAPTTNLKPDVPDERTKSNQNR